MRKRKRLDAGENVVLVVRHLWADSTQVTIDCNVIRANGTSAYLTPKDAEKPFEMKISQRDFRGADSTHSFKVYRTRADYEKSIKDTDELADLQSYVRGALKEMTLNEMRQLVAAIKQNKFSKDVKKRETKRL